MIFQRLAGFSEVFMRLLLLLLLSFTNIYAQDKVFGLDIPRIFTIEYNEWDNEYKIYTSDVLELREKLQKKGLLENNYLESMIFIENTNLSLLIYNHFWEEAAYQQSAESATVTVYIKNDGKIQKKEIDSYLIGESGSSTLAIAENLQYNSSLSFIVDDLNENSILRIKDFANNIFEYSGEELKPLLETIKLYKQFKQLSVENTEVKTNKIDSLYQR